MKLPEGFLVSGIHCGIKKRKLDLGLIYACDGSRGVGFFTRNANQSYSVILSRQHIDNPIKAVIVNSGNANCYSHRNGFKDTRAVVAALAAYLGVNEKNILVASTGIIGKVLPKQKIIKSIPALVNNLTTDTDDFARSILTTDAFVKTASASIDCRGGKVTISGFAKGAGMICPDMATMLGFILTDADVGQVALAAMCREAIAESFNAISVDGCMSTNDTVFVLSSRKIRLRNKTEIRFFKEKLKAVCLKLAHYIVRDGEGATKFVTIRITGARSPVQAKKAAFSLANSNLFKCALYGENANWGRLIAALGQAGIGVDENIGIKAGNLHKRNVVITINLKKGKSSWTVYTTDLSPQYIKINAGYS